MDRHVLLALSLLFTVTCHAEALPGLNDGKASYQEVLTWSKDRIIKQAKEDSTDEEIKEQLEDFPVEMKDTCNGINFLFIKNTPQCGTINCRYLVFSSTNATNYRYISDINFASQQLFCYPEKKKIYLVTSEQETNATGILNLYQFNNQTLTPKISIEVDYSNPVQNKMADSVWNKSLSEQQLLTIFKHK